MQLLALYICIEFNKQTSRFIIVVIVIVNLTWAYHFLVFSLSLYTRSFSSSGSMPILNSCANLHMSVSMSLFVCVKM